MMHDGWGMMGGPWMMLIVGILVLIPVWRISARIGYSGWLALLVLVPIANLLLLYFLAFSEWPIERRLAAPSATDTSS